MRLAMAYGGRLRKVLIGAHIVVLATSGSHKRAQQALKGARGGLD